MPSRFHRVFERGHYEWHRFAMLSDGPWITGDIHIDVTGADRQVLRARDLARIYSRAKALANRRAATVPRHAAGLLVTGGRAADTIEGADRGAI